MANQCRHYHWLCQCQVLFSYIKSQTPPPICTSDLPLNVKRYRNKLNSSMHVAYNWTSSISFSIAEQPKSDGDPTWKFWKKRRSVKANVHLSLQQSDNPIIIVKNPHSITLSNNAPPLSLPTPDTWSSWWPSSDSSMCTHYESTWVLPLSRWRRSRRSPWRTAPRFWHRTLPGPPRSRASSSARSFTATSSPNLPADCWPTNWEGTEWVESGYLFATFLLLISCSLSAFRLGNWFNSHPHPPHSHRLQDGPLAAHCRADHRGNLWGEWVRITTKGLQG